MWNVSGELDPESGHIVSKALNARVDPTNLDPSDGRSHAQKSADALVDMCKHVLDHDDTVVTSGGEKPHVTVTVDYQTLTGASRRLLEIDGTPVPPETMRRLTCDAGVVRVVVDGEGQPLDVGRKVRTVAPAIRRALDLRDAGCTWPGCDAPTSWTDAHHIVHWADGGDTSLNNMQRLCRRHHTTTHQDDTPPERHQPPDT